MAHWCGGADKGRMRVNLRQQQLYDNEGGAEKQTHDPTSHNTNVFYFITLVLLDRNAARSLSDTESIVYLILHYL